MAVSISKTERNLAEVVLDSWNTADRQRAPRIEAWDKAYRSHDPAFVDRDKIKRPPYIKYPYLHRVTTTQTTILLDAVESAPRVLMAQPMAPGPFQRERAEMATEFVEVQFRQKSPDLHTNNFHALRKVAQMGLKYGNAYLQPEWVETRRWWGVRLHAISPYDVWEDARFGRYRFVRRVVSLAQLREIALGISQPIDGETGELRDGGRALDAFRIISSAVSAGNKPAAYVTNEASPYDFDRRFDTGRVAGASTHGQYDDPDEMVRPEDDPYNQTVTIIERHETCEDGSIVRIIPDPRDMYQPLVLQAEQNPYGTCQIIPFLPYFVDNEYYGIGNDEIAGLLAEALSYNLRGSLAAIGAQAWPPVLKTRRANLRDSHIATLYGRIIDVDQPSDLTYMQPSIGASFHQIGMAIAQQAADVGTGEGDIRRGDVGQARNATSAAIAETFANLTDKNVFQQWSDSLQQVGHAMLEMGSIHLTASRAIPILGRDTAAFIEIKPEMLQGPWHVLFGGNPRGATGQQQIALWGQTVTMFGASGELDVRECAREVLRLSGQRDVQRFMARKDEAPDFPPAMEEEALFRFGRMPEISPRNDHRAHWAAHMVTYQNWSQMLGPADQRVQRLGVHLVSHEQAMQAQMGMGGMPSMASPMQPQDTGQPGQPAAFTPHTAQVNEERQMSNRSQPGMSPGPMAPGRKPGQVATGGGAR